MAGFTGNPRIWSRLRFISESTNIREDHAVYGWVFSNNYDSYGAPMASMSIRPDHKRFAFATAQWTIYSGPNVRSRQYHINASVEGDDIYMPALWTTSGESQATASLTVPNPAIETSPMWDMTSSTVPATGSHSAAPGWTGDYSDDGSVFASILYDALDATKIYLSVKQGGTALVTRQLLGITHYRQLGGNGRRWKVDVKLIIKSTTEIWIFHCNELTPGTGEPKLYLSIWNGSTITSTTLIDLGAYSVLAFEVVRGTAGLLYLLYMLRDPAYPYSIEGPVNGKAMVRTISEATRAVSAVIHTSPILHREVPGDAQGIYTRTVGISPGDRIPSNRVFAYKGVNYIVHVYAGQAVMVYTYTDAAPSAVTLLRWGFIEKYERVVEGYTRQQYFSQQDSFGRCTGIEYDPVSDTAYLVSVIPSESSSLSYPLEDQVDISRVYLTRHWQALDAPTWSQQVEIVDEIPSYVFSPGSSSTQEFTQDVLGYVPSRYGTATEGLLYTQSRRYSFGGKLIPHTVLVRVQNWHDPIDIDAEVTIDLSLTVEVTGARTFEVPIAIDLTPSVVVGGTRSRSTQWATQWTHEVDLFVDGEVHIELQPEISITGSLATTHQGEVEIDFNESLHISVAGEVEKVFLVTHGYVSVGVTFLEDFHQYMNDHRAAVWGLPPVPIIGMDARSLAVLKVLDISQRHSDNMADTRWYAHGAEIFPLGWRTFAERLAKVSTAGAENLQADSRYYRLGYVMPTAYDMWISWRYSPPHYANMMTDWDAVLGPNSTQYVYSSLTTTFGLFPEYDGGGPPWDTYPIVPLDPAHINDPYLNTVYATDNFIFIKEAYVEATLIERWQRDELQALLLAHRWERKGLARVQATHVASYSMPIGVVHYALYGNRVSTTHTLEGTHSVAASHEAVHSHSLSVIPTAHDAPYELQKLMIVSVMEAVWADRIAVEHTALYEDTGRTRAEHASLYEDYSRPRFAHVAPYEAPRSVRQAHTAPYTIQQQAVRAHVGSASLGPLVAQSHEASYVMELLNPVRRSFLVSYDLPNAVGSAFSAPQTLVMLNGQVIEIDDGYISCDFDSPGYTFSCKIADIEFIRGARQGDALYVTFEGTDYTFFLSDISRTAAEGSAGDDVTISGLSPIMLLDAPYAETVTYAPDSAKNFSEILQELLGISVDFSRHIDWMVPFGRAQNSSQTPLAAARGFLEAVGSRLLSNPDGSVYVLPRYPVGFDALPSGVPPHAFEETANMFTRASTYAYAKGYNRFRVRDTDASFADQIEFDEDTSIASVYVSPYRTTWRLDCTTTPGIFLNPQGEILEEHEELWDFTAGTARAKYPILDLVSVNWITDSLGGVSFDPYSTRVSASTAANFGYGLAKVVYRAKCSKFLLTSSAPIEATQLIIVEQ